MNLNATIPILSNNENDGVTYIAVPFHLFQQATQQQQQQQSFLLDQNVLFKTLPDGMVIVDSSNQVCLISQ